MNSYQMVISNKAGEVITPSIINAYSALTIPGYWRAVNFFVGNMSSFGHSVQLEEEDQSDHRLTKILKRRPNQFETAYQFRSTLYFNMFHQGNGYANIKRPSPLSNDISGLYLLDPCDITPFRPTNEILIDSLGQVQPGEFISPEERQQYYYQHSLKRIIPANDMIHLKGLSPDGMIGYCPIELLAESLQKAKLIDTFGSTLITKGTHIQGVIEIPEGVSEERAEQILATVRRYKSGKDKAGELLVLSDGAKLVNTTLSPQAMQLIESGKISNQQIAQITGVPPQHFFEFADSKYNNSIEAMGTDVVRFLFRVWIENIEAELSSKLLTTREQDDGYYVNINPDALLRGNSAEQAQIVRENKKAGIISKNEGRELLGFPKDEDPESDKLETLGDSSPAAASTAEPDASATETPVEEPVAEQEQELADVQKTDHFAALEPLIEQAARRIDNKTVKALGDLKGKSSEQTSNGIMVFAERQEKYVREEFGTISTAIQTLTGRILDVPALADAYGSELRGKLAGNEPRALIKLVKEQLDGNS